jgi:preprotein translocase subunit SecY
VGGNLSRSTIFALGIMPYISASIFMQIGARGGAHARQDAEGRGRAEEDHAVHALRHGGARGGAGLRLRALHPGVTGAVSNPGAGFIMQMVLFLTTGALFVMWLGEQITERGLGNGASLLIFFSIVERFWPAIFQTFSFVSTGAVPSSACWRWRVVMLGVVAGWWR